MRIFSFLFFVFCLISCSSKTNSDIIFKDVEDYNFSVLKLKISQCAFIDSDASCANKSESYIISCKGSDFWYKWDKSVINGKKIVRVYTLPKGFTDYQCNPWLNTKSEFRAHHRKGENWVMENYVE